MCLYIEYKHGLVFAKPCRGPVSQPGSNDWSVLRLQREASPQPLSPVVHPVPVPQLGRAVKRAPDVEDVRDRVLAVPEPVKLWRTVSVHGGRYREERAATRASSPGSASFLAIVAPVQSVPLTLMTPASGSSAVLLSRL